MKKLFALMLVPALAGCFSASPIPVAHWPVDYVGPVSAVRPGKLGIGRVSQVVVRAPYNAEGISESFHHPDGTYPTLHLYTFP